MQYFIALLIVFRLTKGESFTYYEVPDLKSILNCDSSKTISAICCNTLENYIEQLTKKVPLTWALPMLDATSKLQPGILSGNLKDFGNYDQCLEIEGTTKKGDAVIGKHCVGKLAIDLIDYFKKNGNETLPQTLSMDVFWSICIPHQCSASDLNVLFKKAHIPIAFSNELCQTKESTQEFTTTNIALSVILGIFIFLFVASTAYDIFMYYIKREKKYPLLIAFSAFSNGKKLLTINKDPNQLTCLDGIRFLSIMWVVLGHEYSIVKHCRPFINLIKVFDWIKRAASMYIIGANVSVDTFFVLSGLLVSYLFFGAMKKGIKFNITMYYVHRYLRLTPAVTGVILVHLSIVKYFGSGPIWPQYYKYMIEEQCEKEWWKTLLYIENYFTLRDICIPQAWYLMIDMQLFVISPLILFPLKQWPKCTITGIILLAIGSILWGFFLAWDNEWFGIRAWPNLIPMEVKLNYYIKTHTRAAPWLIGIILGYVIFKHKNSEKFKLNTSLVLLLWILSLTVLATCIFAAHNLLVEEEYHRFENAAYIAFIRPSWAIALCWIIYACLFGYGGPINAFLSWSLFLIGSRFTYSIYLVHYTFILVSASSARVPMYFNDYTVVHEFFGDFVMIFVISILWTLIFESPIIIIEKVLFGRSGSKAESKELKKTNGVEAKVELP